MIISMWNAMHFQFLFHRSAAASKSSFNNYKFRRCYRFLLFMLMDFHHVALLLDLARANLLSKPTIPC